MNNLTTIPMWQSAVIYTRVSPQEHNNEDVSINAQLQLLRAYAKEHGLFVLHEYADRASTKQAKRPGFNDMVTFLQQEARRTPRDEACHILLAENPDRLYRNLPDYVTLDNLDIEVHLVKEHTVLAKDSNSSEDVLHASKVLMAKNYLDHLAEEVKQGMAEKARQGLYPSRAPLGYVNATCGEKKVIQPDPVTGPVVKNLFEWFATGHYSLQELTDKAYEEGLRSRNNGKRFTRAGMYKLLRNPVYYGDFIWGRKLYHGIHEPLISRELFDRVQRILEQANSR